MNFPDFSLPPIAIIDDSQDDAFLLRYRLRLGGIAHPVVTFETTTAALACLGSRFAVQTRPHLVFTDIRMPGAPDLIAELRDDPSWDDTKLVVLTYSNDPADLKKALELRIDGYLLKFPDPDILAEFVQHGPWFDASHLAPARVAAHALCA
jgi:CheY-like chemotaxis protein